MSKIVHILNGDSTLETLQKSELEGHAIVWREMLCEGPLTKEVGSDEFWIQRYKFFKERLNVERLEYFDRVIKELVAIEDLSEFKEVVLWFEYDLFCQINLLALCSYILKFFRKDISYYLICTGKETGKDGWQTLGDYTPKEYVDLYNNKVKLSRNDLLYANESWNAFVEDHKNNLENFNFNKNQKFKYLDLSIKQYLKNLEETKGLDTISYKILQIMDEGAQSKTQMIRKLLLWQRSKTVNGFGDLQYVLRLNDLKDYYKIKNDAYILNTKGQKVLV